VKRGRPATDQEVARAQRLAQAGPPREAVGLQPFTLTVPLVAPKQAGDMQGEIFWDVAPYVTLAIVVVGTWWRYRYDKFGWTTPSSQLYESRLLRIASPMFHFGILVVVFGHVIGLLIPASQTDALGLSHHAYHVQAVVLGSIAGIATFVARKCTRARPVSTHTFGIPSRRSAR
jgi:nitrate reductase alpha subunit